MKGKDTSVTESGVDKDTTFDGVGSGRQGHTSRVWGGGWQGTQVEVGETIHGGEMGEGRGDKRCN